MSTSLVHILIDEKVKAKAAKAWAAMGLTVSDAVRIMLTRVAAEKALPFDIRVPNREPVAAMREARVGGLETFDSVEAMLAKSGAEN